MASGEQYILFMKVKNLLILVFVCSVALTQDAWINQEPTQVPSGNGEGSSIQEQKPTKKEENQLTEQEQNPAPSTPTQKPKPHPLDPFAPENIREGQNKKQKSFYDESAEDSMMRQDKSKGQRDSKGSKKTGRQGQRRDRNSRRRQREQHPHRPREGQEMSDMKIMVISIAAFVGLSFVVCMCLRKGTKYGDMGPRRNRSRSRRHQKNHRHSHGSQPSGSVPKTVIQNQIRYHERQLERLGQSSELKMHPNNKINCSDSEDDE